MIIDLDAFADLVAEKVAARIGEQAPAPTTTALSVPAAAERYSVSPGWVRAQIRAGRLPRLGTSRTLLVRPADLEALLARPAAPDEADARADELEQRRREKAGR